MHLVARQPISDELLLSALLSSVIAAKLYQNPQIPQHQTEFASSNNLRIKFEMSSDPETFLPYNEPGIVTILIQSSFLLILNVINTLFDKLIFCGLLGQVFIGTAWGTPGAEVSQFPRTCSGIIWFSTINDFSSAFPIPNFSRSGSV